MYYGGYFKAKMTFPRNFPHSPPGTSSLYTKRQLLTRPDFKFIRPLYHPNIYPDGRLCISILHPPGDDEMSGELAAERWSPVQRVETVLISILSLLDDAEVSSPANVDAGVMLRNKPDEYKEMVKKDLELSKQDIPADFVMPTHETAWKKKEDEGDFDMSWEDSDVESFGGSESDLGSDQEMDDSDFEGNDDDADEDEDDK
jgi:ubiquitin-conjugating enzyme E2 R